MKLFSPYQIRNVTLKNRIVMSPMCMYAAKDDGFVTDWHVLHYASRAMGQVALVFLESTAVSKDGRLSVKDLGVWDDKHIAGLTELASTIKKNGAVAGIQISHAGRKAEVGKPTVAPSAITYSEKYPMPNELSIEEIQIIVSQFRSAAKRSKKAGFDIIEIHGAHGYLIHQFLSPLSNKRQDEYGGNIENRYRFLDEIITAIKSEWNGPVFVRLSLNEYNEEGNSFDDYAFVLERLKEKGIDLVDCSSGAIVPAYINVYPGYQVPLAEWVKKQSGLDSGAVGLITSGLQAEEILKNGRADLVFIGRELLRNPYWPLKAARDLNAWIESHPSYRRGWREVVSQKEPKEIWAPGKDLVKNNR